MADEQESKGYVVDHNNLPTHYPTHRHSAEFWENLGRTVATFGFLEEILGKAIFSLTATRRIPEDTFEEEFKKWLPTLERALYDPLGGLIDSYGKAVRNNSGATIQNPDDLLKRLREASTIRNVLCHGSWRNPDDKGRSIPRFVDKKNRVFQTPIDVECLQQMQRHTVELACAVFNSVTLMGWQFPGSSGPGNHIFQHHRAQQEGKASGISQLATALRESRTRARRIIVTPTRSVYTPLSAQRPRERRRGHRPLCA